jgi:hypothetical protein
MKVVEQAPVVFNNPANQNYEFNYFEDAGGVW